MAVGYWSFHPAARYVALGDITAMHSKPSSIQKNLQYILLNRLQARMLVPNMAFYNLLVFLANVTSTNSHFFSPFFKIYLFIFIQSNPHCPLLFRWKIIIRTRFKGLHLLHLFTPKLQIVLQCVRIHLHLFFDTVVSLRSTFRLKCVIRWTEFGVAVPHTQHKTKPIGSGAARSYCLCRSDISAEPACKEFNMTSCVRNSSRRGGFFLFFFFPSFFVASGSNRR